MVSAMRPRLSRAGCEQCAVLVGQRSVAGASLNQPSSAQSGKAQPDSATGSLGERATPLQPGHSIDVNALSLTVWRPAAAPPG